MGTYKQKLIIGLVTISLLTLVTGCSGKALMSGTSETGLEITSEEETPIGAVPGDSAMGEEGVLEATTSDEGQGAAETAQENPSIIIDVIPDQGSSEGTIASADPKDVDLIFFMGQSNMSGCGGDASLAPAVISGAGYEYRAVSDPFTLHDIREPFGFAESVVGGIWDVPGAKRGTLVSAFINEYYRETGRTVIAVSASAGGTSTEDWLTPGFVTDISVRVKNAQDYLQSNGYLVKNQYVVWLQGESDALDGMSAEGYQTNMDTIIRPLFIAGFSKVFVITPGQINTNANFFNRIIDSQLDMCKKSGYYALATTMLSEVDVSYMVDEWHYNQKVLNLVGTEAAKSVAYYTNNRKEMCLYDYKHDTTYVPMFFDYDENTMVEPEDIDGILAQQ